jgi:hypothetical protein
MYAAMTIEKIRDLSKAQPFQPFVIHLADGRDIPVHHRDFMATAPSGRTLIVYQSDDSHNIIDLLLVTDLEVPARINGSRKRRRSR